MRTPNCWLAFPLLLLAAGCSAPLSVEEVESSPPVAHVLSPSTLARAVDTSAEDPLAELGPLLDALRVCSRAISRGDVAAIPEYNFLTARLVDRLIEAGVQPWQKSLKVSSGSTRYLLRGTEPADLSDPSRKFIPTDRLAFAGPYARDTGRTFGAGAPLVSFTDHTIDRLNPYRTVTAVVRFEGDDAVIDLVDPFRTRSVSIGGRRVPLHSDFNASAAYFLARARIDKLGLVRLLNPSRFDNTASINAVQPYDAGKIPVLVVHGLQDTPASFMPMYFELMDDPAIRDKYQFWVFTYPSGYPYPLPAATLRKELDTMRKLYPGHKDIVIIGHSMGGLISRLLVTDVGDSIWRKYFGKPPAETKIGGKNRELLESALIFNARRDISRAIFIAAPHRGSELASNIVGRIGNRLVRFPDTLSDMRDSLESSISLDTSAVVLERVPSSIDSLSPENPFVEAINQFPIRAGIPYHSIIGDRGKGDAPESSDGVVAYWSSHLDGAASEKIVPSGHGAHQHAEGIEEVRRILCLHAGLPYKAPDKADSTQPE